MNVLHIYKSAMPDSMGGVEQVIHQLCCGSRKFGVNSEVFTLTKFQVPRTIELDGYMVHRARMDFQVASTSFSISAFLRFKQLAKSADIIHYHFPWPFMDLMHFAVRINNPTVVTYHSDIVRQKILLNVYRPLKRRFLNSVDRIVATSPNYFNTSDVLNRFAHKVSVIPIGLDRSTYPIPDPMQIHSWRNRFGEKFFLFVGLLRYYKGLHILIEAAKGRNYPIVILGAGPIEQELKMQAQRLGVPNIHFLGRLPDSDKVALLMLCYAVIFPSHLRSEAFGISLLEGAMFAKPMISSEIGTGTTYINVNKETGLVVPPSDPFALGQAMDYLWRHPEEAREMGHRAEARFWDLFTADQMIRSHINLYHDLIQSRSEVL